MVFNSIRMISRLLFMAALVGATVLIVLSLKAQAAGSGVDDAGREQQLKAKPTPEEALKRFAINLSDLARRGLLEPFIGDRVELQRVQETLRKAGNKGTYIIGDAGAGKTALVEASAGSIQGADVYTLNLGALKSETGYRGTLEDNISALKEAFVNRPDRILFIDEIHRLVEGGNTDIMQEFKEPLGRGQIKFIGATTQEEFRAIEKDPALVRRGNIHELPKTTVERVINILSAHVDKIEKAHGMQVMDEAIVRAIELAQKNFPEQPLASKALDIIDRACIREKMAQEFGGFDHLRLLDKQEALELRLSRLQKDMARFPNRLDIAENVRTMTEELVAVKSVLEASNAHLAITKLTAEVSELERQASSLHGQGKQAEAAQIRNETIPLRRAELKALTNTPPPSKDVLTVKEVGTFVANEVGIDPVFFSGEGNILERISAKLKERVIGQDHAIERIIGRMKHRFSGVSTERGPIAVILLDGPTGTGKSALTEALAEAYLGRPDIVEINMNQLNAHSGTSIWGSAPGIVDSEKGGVMDEVRRKPYSVVSIDEVNMDRNGHLYTFMQAFDKGFAKDGMNRTIDLSNTIIVMQANFTDGRYNRTMPAELVEATFNFPKGSLEGMNRAQIDKIVLDHILSEHGLTEAMRNRMITVVYNSISFEQAVKITKANLDSKARYILRKFGATLNYDNAVIEAITRVGYDPVKNARPLKDARVDTIETMLADLVMEKRLERGQVLDLSFQANSDNRGGRLIVKTNGAQQIAQDIFFNSVVKAEQTVRNTGEAGRPQDPFDSKTAVKKAVRDGKARR